MDNIHIIFGHSAAATLKQALKEIGNEEQVFNCWGDYQAGPLTVGFEDRLDWLCDNFYDVEFNAGGEELRQDYLECTKVFKELCLRRDVHKTVWFSKLCAKDYCGYLEFLFHTHAKPDLIQVVELSSALPKENSRSALSSGGLPPEYLIRALSSCHLLTQDELNVGTALWARLREENSDLRAMSADGLCSAELDFFDHAMLSFVTENFQAAARIVGNTLGQVDGKKFYMQGNNDLFYFSRLRKLRDKGAIEWRGPFGNMREAEVRLAAKTQEASKPS